MAVKAFTKTTHSKQKQKQKALKRTTIFIVTIALGGYFSSSSV